MSNNNKAYKKLGKNIGFMTIGNFASKLLNYFLVPLYTAVLSTDEYGTADILMTTVSLVLPIFTLQIGDSVMRFLLDGKNEEEVLNSSFAILRKGIIISLFCSPILLLFKSLSPFYFLFLGIFLADVFNTFLGQYVKGIEKVGVYSISGVINTFVVAISNIVFLLLLHMRIEGYLLSYLVGYVSSIAFILIRTRINPIVLFVAKGNSMLCNELLSYSIPLVPNSICWWINNSSDKYLVRLFCDASVTGVYAISYKVPSLLSTVMLIFFSAWQISSVENFGSKESRKFYSDVFDKTMLINTMVGLILITFSKQIGSILYEKDFYVAWKYTIPLIVAFYFNTLASFIGTIYTAAKKTKMLFITSVISALVNIALNVLLIPIMGALGAALATIVCYFVILIIRIVNTRKIFCFEIKYFKLIICSAFISISGLIAYIDFHKGIYINIILLLASVIMVTISFKKIISSIINEFKSKIKLP